MITRNDIWMDKKRWLFYLFVCFQGKVNQKVEGKALMVCDEVTVVILQGQLEGQLAHVPTRKVMDEWDLEL